MRHKKYIAKRLVLFLILIMIETINSSADIAGKTTVDRKNIPKELVFWCNNTIPFTYVSACHKKCLNINAYYSASSQQFICFQHKSPATVISKSTDPCECGFMLPKRGYRESCNPKLPFEKIINDAEKCKLECPKYTILRGKKDTVSLMQIIWCGILTQPYAILEGLDWSKKYNDESESGYDCVCGVESLEQLSLISSNENERNNTLVQNKIGKRKHRVDDALENNESRNRRTRQESQSVNRRIKIISAESRKLAMTCSIGTFVTSTKRICQSTCNNAKTYILPNSLTNELVCFHYTKLARKIPSLIVNNRLITQIEDDTCDCGSDPERCSDNHIENLMAKKVPLNGIIQSCVPQLKHQLQEENERLRDAKIRCKKTCENYNVYIFDTFPRSTLSRCELKTFSPTIRETLDWSIVNVSAKAGTIKGYEYTCECGLNDVSTLINANDKISKNIESPSRTQISNESHPESTTSWLSIFHSTIEFNEEPFADLYIPSPFHQNEINDQPGEDQLHSLQGSQTSSLNLDDILYDPVEYIYDILNKYSFPVEDIVVPSQFHHNQEQSYEVTSTTSIANERLRSSSRELRSTCEYEGNQHVPRDVPRDNELSYLLPNTTENVKIDDLQLGHGYTPADDFFKEPASDFQKKYASHRIKNPFEYASERQCPFQR